MKTFDIAVNYLKDIDFKMYPVIVKRGESNKVDEKLHEVVNTAKKKFDADESNNKSNSYYRNICFITAFYHLIFKAHGWTSFWDVAVEIIEVHKHIINTEFEPYKRTVYPKVMLDSWIKYCEELKTKSEILEGEIREELFFNAYHYIIEPERA